MGTRNVGLVVRFNPKMTIREVKIQARLFWDISESLNISLERLDGEAIRGLALRKSNIKPGDCIRVMTSL